MGHIDLHALPAAQPWRRVAGFLNGSAGNPAQAAIATADAAAEQLARLRDDPNLNYCVWLLVRLANAAQKPDFAESITQLGLDPYRSTSVISFLAQVTARMRDELDRHPGSGPFGEIALQTLTHTLSEAVCADSVSLFTTTFDDVERAFRRVTTPTQFSRLLARFFGELLARVLRFYVDRAVPLQIGQDGGFASIQQSEIFLADLNDYARVIGRVMTPLAEEWFSKHHYLTSGAIGRDNAAWLVSHAIEKIQLALQPEGAVA